MKMITSRRMITIIAIAMSIFHLYTAGVRPYPAMQQRATHLTFVLMLIFLLFPLKKSDQESKPLASYYLDLLLVFLSLFIGAYVMLEYEGFPPGRAHPISSIRSLASRPWFLLQRRQDASWAWPCVS